MSGSAGLRLTETQRRDWLRLIRTPGIGPATFRDLINRFGSAASAIDHLPVLARSARLPHAPKVPSGDTAQRELDAAARFGARFVALGEPDYPAQLVHVDYPPPLLAVRGEPAVFGLPCVAIVGARNASVAGMRFARKIATDLGEQGFCVVSGLARGIDRAAHEGSLRTGSVGVLAGGLDRPYPPENAALAEDLCQVGAVVSEMPFGWEPRAQDFPRRNRLVAGLSIGLLVVEAARRSGSLISARLASEMGRLVFAVPGSPLDPRAEGTNRLLKDGAILVTEAADLVAALSPLIAAPAPPSPTVREAGEPPEWQDAPPGDRDRLIEALGPVPTTIDDLIRHTALPTATVLSVLLELDLAGRLERHAGGCVSLLPESL